MENEKIYAVLTGDLIGYSAKSIFRLSVSRKVGEYILIGTLFSFAIAIAVGIIAGLFLSS